MNLLIYELKKIWNWRMIVIISVMGVLVWFTFLKDSLDSYDSLSKYGIYGSYQNEMFELYGDILDSEELDSYDIPGKKAEVIEELNDIISTESIFKENNITTYEEYVMFHEEISNASVRIVDEEKGSELLTIMQEKLENNAQSLEELYASPLNKLHALITLEGTYIFYKDYLQTRYIDNDSRPVVVQAANHILDINNGNLIRYDLTSNFSNYVAGIGVFSLISITILIAPFLTMDRMWGVNLIQYSSHVGRKIFSIQLVVTIFSAAFLSFLLIVLAYIPFMANGAIDYWEASVMAFHPGPGGLQLYDITFGQYACLLAGIVILFNLCAATFTFVLARFSQNIIVMMMKIVPFCIATAGLLIISVNDVFSDENLIFNLLFQGKARFSEVLFGTIMGIVGLVIVWYLTKREKHVDVD